MSNCNGHSWSKFFWRDWSGEMALRTCSLAARGFWMEMLCVMHEGAPIGHLTVNEKPATHRQMAAWAACTEREAKKHETELEAAGVFSRTPAGVIYCRRMAREGAADTQAREAWRAYGSNGGNPNIIRGTVPKDERQRSYRRSDAPQKTQRIFQRDGGRCHWCSVELVLDNPQHPHFFHVDHVVAVRDGGGSEEENLVAACQRCNMERAKHPKPNGTDAQEDGLAVPVYRPPGTTSDNNPPLSESVFRQQPQKLEERIRKIPPRDPPVTGGVARRGYRNGFHELDRREGGAGEVADFQEVRRRLAGGSDG